MTHAELAARRKKMADLLSAGLSPGQVAGLFHVSIGTVHNAASEHCVTPVREVRKRSHAGPRNNERLKLLASMTMQGSTQSDIARALNVSRARIGQLISIAAEAGHNVRRRQPRRTVACRQCGEQFTPANSKRMYCSRECHFRGRRGRNGDRSARHSQYEYVALTCAGCGKEFARSKYHLRIREHCYRYKGLADSKRHFCTRDCYLATRKKEGSK